jgi:hypothetical protein
MQLATDSGILSPLPVREAKFRMSLYAHDAVMFIKPDAQELAATLHIMHVFGAATGLHINVAKCSIAPIRCQDMDLDAILAPFAGESVSFPIRYLGLPLWLGRLRSAHLHLDRARSHLSLPGRAAGSIPVG